MLHRTRTNNPSRVDARPLSVRYIEPIDKAPRDVRKEIESRAEMIQQMSYAELHASPRRKFMAWLLPVLRRAVRRLGGGRRTVQTVHPRRGGLA